jgi:putative cofactor-binding repeat protein
MSNARQNVDKLNGIVSVLEYGAKGDGATDNTAAIQAALTYAGTSGGSVYVPGAAAAYRVTDELTIPNGVTIFGDGYRSLIQMMTAGKNLLVAGHDTGVYLLRLKMVAGNNLDLQKQNAVYIADKTNVIVQDNWIELVDINCGVQIYTGRNITVRGNIIYGATWGEGAGPAASASDILAYSAASGGRYIIEGNYCLSNNSQGIAVDLLGYDQDAVINANVCVTLDPATCTQGGAWSEIATGGVRRHAIMVGYNNSSVNGPRTIVSNNVCRNTRWTGIYQQGEPSGPVLITGNMCSRNGYDTANTISGGIYIAASTADAVVNGNVIDEFQNTQTATGGITYNPTSIPTAGATISNNTIKDSAGIGILLATRAARASVVGNTIVGSTNIDILLSNGSALATGGMVISRNTIRRTSGNSVTAIVADQQDGTLITVIEGNYIRGFDASNAVSTNAGIRTRVSNSYTRIIRNTVENFNVGVTSDAYWASATRHFSADISDNTLRDCTYGIGAAATADTSTVPLCNNVFDNVTTPVSAAAAASPSGFTVGYIARKDQLRIVALSLNAAPSVGTWAIGDRVEYTTPTAGGFIGAVCVTAGNPGTWKTFGAVSA